MKIIVTEDKLKKLKNLIQSQIDSELNNIREESWDWGLGEMDELDEIDSINRIEVDSIGSDMTVYITIYQNEDYDRDEYYNVTSSIEYVLESWLPTIKLELKDIIKGD